MKYKTNTVCQKISYSEKKNDDPNGDVKEPKVNETTTKLQLKKVLEITIDYKNKSNSISKLVLWLHWPIIKR